MYVDFYGLRDRPFDLTSNPRYLVLTPAHREALSNLQYGIASRKGMTLLIGEAGTGKTTIIRSALEQQPAQVHCVSLQNSALTRGEFMELLAVQFGLSDDARHSKATFLLELERLLRWRHANGEGSVLVVDEAQSLPLELLEEIRLLANMEADDSKLLSVIIAGQPELATRLNDVALRQLKQRIALRCELRVLTEPESFSYVAGRLAAAGGNGLPVFTREAVARIHRGARGIPRLINVIADNALLGGFALQQRPVESSTVDDVCGDFDLRDDGPAAVSPVPLPRQAGNAGAASPTVFAFAAAPPSVADQPRPVHGGAVLASWRRFFGF